MKLLHTSDWHLGTSLRGGISYVDDQLFFINQIYDIAVSHSVDGIIIAGDVFDRDVASQQAIRIYDEAVTHMCVDLDIPVFIIAGNHDGAGRLSQCSRLLKKSGLYITGSLEKDVQVINFGDTDIYMLPWISTDRVKTTYPETADMIESLEDAYRVALDKMRETFDSSHKKVLVSHSFTLSDGDKDSVVGNAALIDASVYDGFDYIALGHLHGPHNVTDKVRYSGSPMAYSFGTEEKQTKSVTIYDSETGECEEVALTPLHERHTIKDTLENILKADYPENVIKGYVRLEITDQFVGYETASNFKLKYENVLEYTCPNIETDSGKITMSMDELELVKDDPEKVFKSYCSDILDDITLSDSFITMFNEAVSEYGKETE